MIVKHQHLVGELEVFHEWLPAIEWRSRMMGQVVTASFCSTTARNRRGFRTTSSSPASLHTESIRSTRRTCVAAVSWSFR